MQPQLPCLRASDAWDITRHCTKPRGMTERRLLGCSRAAERLSVARTLKSRQITSKVISHKVCQCSRQLRQLEMQAEYVIFLYPNSKWKHWENGSSYWHWLPRKPDSYFRKELSLYFSAWCLCANALFFLPSSPIPASPCSTSQKTPSSRIRVKRRGWGEGITMEIPSGLHSVIK